MSIMSVFKNISILFLSLILISACATKTAEKNKTASPTTTEIEQNNNEPIETARLDSSQVFTKLAFGSCSHQKQPQPIWTTMLNANPDLYISMGDMVYASKPEDKPIAEQYRLQSLVPEFRKFHSLKPVIGVWDDHDFGQNDGGADNKYNEEARLAYLQFFQDDAGYITRSQNGIYHSIFLGPADKTIQIIFLDTRYFRSPLEKNEHPKDPLDIYQPTADKSKTFLGEKQWQWLNKELKKPAEIKIVISSVEFLAEEHGFEKWALFPHERQRFLDLLKNIKPKNLFIISGDRHIAEISKMNVPGYGDLYDITSSGINRKVDKREEANKYRVGEIFNPNNFGLANVDWQKRKIRFDIIGTDGKSANGFEVNLK